MKKKIAFFDFDGTLIQGDSLYILLRANHSLPALVWAVLSHSHLVVMVVLGMYDKEKLKEKLFGALYRGTSYTDFIQHCMSIQPLLVSSENKELTAALQKRITDGYEVAIVTASMSEWVKPWTGKYGNIPVISTVPEVIDGILTGRFASKNCNGIEKKNRILSAYDLSGYGDVAAYGNSKGDYDMFSLATEAYMINKGSTERFKK